MEPEMEIRSLYNIGFDTLFKAFKAFADYEMRKQIPITARWKYPGY